MAATIITAEDLQVFRYELLEEIRKIIGGTQTPTKEWLKSPEVRKLLKISPGTLQNLRINGTLRYTKIGSIIYYSYEDIEKLLKANMVDHSSNTRQQRIRGL